MQRSRFYLTADLDPATYRRVLGYLLSICSTLSFVIRDQLKVSHSCMEFLDACSRFVRAHKRTSEWPGTRLLDSEAQVFFLNSQPEVWPIIVDAAPSFFGWLQPELPEDIALYHDEDCPLLTTICHEREAYFDLIDDEKRHLLSIIPRTALSSEPVAH